MFLVAVAFNGICTGMSQNLGASLAGEFEGASKAFLLGESLSPLVAVGISAVVGAFPVSLFAAGAFTLVAVQAFLFGAVLSLTKLSRLRPQPLGYPDTIGRCIATGGPAQEYAVRRMAALLGNFTIAMIACAMWLFFVYSAPFISVALCRGDHSCQRSLPKLMLSISNVAAVLGRLLGFRMSGGKLCCLLFESVALCATGSTIIIACVEAWPVASFFASPAVVACMASGLLTLWPNVALMRNDHNAQQSCTHSLIAPCSVTTQVMWLAIQTGSILGSVLASYW